MSEPTRVKLYGSRGAGKTQAVIESLLAQANERGIRVEVVYPQGEPVEDEHAARYDGSLRCADCGRLMGLEGHGGDGERWVHLEVHRTIGASDDDEPNCCGAGEMACSPTCSAPKWTALEQEADRTDGSSDGPR